MPLNRNKTLAFEGCIKISKAAECDRQALLRAMSAAPISSVHSAGGKGDFDSPDRSRLVRLYRNEIRQGRLDCALEACERLVELGPINAETWYNLGYLRRCARQYRSALEAYASALQLGAAQPEHLHVNRAAILLDHLGQADAASDELRKAIECDPGFIPAWLNLGQACEDLGDKGNAIAAYRQALALDPTIGRAAARLAELGALPISVVKDRLARVSASSDDAAELHMALAHHYERTGNFDRAFAAMAEAKRIVWNLSPSTQRYDHQAAARLVQELAMFAPTQIALPGEFGSELIFVVGMFRSGSTLLERLLARHPRVQSIGESEAIPALTANLTAYPSGLASLDTIEIARLADRYLSEAHEKVGEHDVLIDKRPDNFLHVPLIKTLFPGARIVHTRRRASDTMLSIFGNLFGPGVTYANRLEDIADWQAHHDALAERWNAIWPGSIHSIDYEQLVAAPAATIADLLAFCGLGWDDSCLDPAGAPGAVQTMSQWQVRQPIHSRSVGRSGPFLRYFDEALRKR